MIKKIVLIIFGLVISSCANHNIKSDVDKEYYYSSGFALIYNQSHYDSKIINKNMNNQKIEILHANLKKNTLVRLINPENGKSIMTKVNKKANFPNIFNTVITKKIASSLELNLDNPLIEIIELKKNKTFIAKESNIFDEEKNVAEKAPVDEVKMDDLTKESDSKKKVFVNKKNYIILISDFYYIESANNLKKTLIKNIQNDIFSIKKINSKKYRLYAGPFESFNALKNIYISLNNLGFESLNILKN